MAYPHGHPLPAYTLRQSCARRREMGKIVKSVRPRSAGAQVAAAALAERPMTEAELQRAVIDLARGLGWGTTRSARKDLLEQAEQLGVEPPSLDGLIYHPRYSLGSEPGWPDLTLIRRQDRRLVFAELKTEKGRLSSRQSEVLDLLNLLATPFDLTAKDHPCFLEVHIWRPSDLVSGRIAEVLR